MAAKGKKIEKTRLSNGLTVLSLRRQGFQGLAVGIWIKTGTRFEETSQAGISHFLEHMVFKGTRRRNPFKIASEVESVGGELNAFTLRESTCFHVLLPRREAEVGFSVLTDMILNSTFPKGEVERERRVILEEIAMVEDTPEELVHDLFLEKVFPDHGLGLRILGTEKTVEDLRRGDLIRYFHQNYIPEKTVVSVVGDISHRKVLELVRPLAKLKWPGRKKPTKRFLRKPPRMTPGFWWEERPVEQAHAVWGVEARKFSLKDRYVTLVISQYLAGGMSSELYQKIREKAGLAYSVYSFYLDFVETGLLTVYFGTSPTDVLRCLKMTESTLQKLARVGMTRSALKTSKNSILGSFRLADDELEDQMVTIARNEISRGGQVSLDEICRHLNSISNADIKRIGKRLWEANRSLAVVGPKTSASKRKQVSKILQ